jgi:hypothetical protein
MLLSTEYMLLLFSFMIVYLFTVYEPWGEGTTLLKSYLLG